MRSQPGERVDWGDIFEEEPSGLSDVRCGDEGRVQDSSWGDLAGGAVAPLSRRKKGWMEVWQRSHDCATSGQLHMWPLQGIHLKRPSIRRQSGSRNLLINIH